jgi:hypothetical protein
MKAWLAAAALRGVLRVIAISALGLGVVGAAVMGLGDGSVLTAPPEAVAEQFVRKLATHNWAPARAQLTRELAGHVDEGRLRASLRAFEQRWGRIRQVEGQAGPRSGDQAWANALVTTTRTARLPVSFPLLRRSGVWRVAGVQSLPVPH